MGRLISVDEIPHYAGGELRLDSLELGRPDFRMRIFRYAASEIEVPPTEDFVVIVYRQGTGHMHRRVSADWKHGQVRRGSSAFLTRAASSCWRWDAALEVGHFYIAPALLQTIATDMFDRAASEIAFHDLVCAQDPVLDWLNLEFAREIAARAPGGRLYFDAMAQQVCVHLLRHYACIRFKPPRPQGRFSQGEAQRLEEYIEHHLSRNLTLDELAAACHCSAAQFSRKFRLHYQMRPHVFVQQRRVERARQLLKKRSLALKEIALDCGFSDQSHLCRAFRKWLCCMNRPGNRGGCFVIVNQPICQYWQVDCSSFPLPRQAGCNR